MTECLVENNSARNVSYFNLAIKLAEEALQKNEVPVGCVLVYNDIIIGCGLNRVNFSKNPTQHAEFVAFEEAEHWCQKNNKKFTEVMVKTSLYVSLEPCIMCASAIYQLRIAKVYFGASNPRFGGLQSVASNAQYGHDHKIDIQANIDIERSVRLLRKFYERENPFAPEEKRKVK